MRTWSLPKSQNTRRAQDAQHVDVEFRTWEGRTPCGLRDCPSVQPETRTKTSHTTPRAPDTRISSHLPELSQGHTISISPSIRFSKLSTNTSKHSIAATWQPYA